MHPSHQISRDQLQAHILVTSFPLHIAAWRHTYFWRLHGVIERFHTCRRISHMRSSTATPSSCNSISFFSKMPRTIYTLQINLSATSASPLDSAATQPLTNTRLEKYIRHTVGREVNFPFFTVLLILRHMSQILHHPNHLCLMSS